MASEIISTGRTRDGREFVVRKYEARDRERVRWICSETGFVGKPQEAIFIGREEFADLWSSYWTDYEPESAFVAEVAGRAEGYLLGCLDTRKQEKIWGKEILPKILRRLVRPAWWKHRINRKFVRAMAMSRMKGEFKMPHEQLITDYPAHLHTNIGDPAFRGHGLGKAMMLAYFDFLRDHHLQSLHLGTTTHNREAVPFYYKLGFTTLIKKHFTAYDHAITDPPLYVLYLVKTL